MTSDPPFQLRKLEGLTLWRDGHMAVVTLTLGGRAVRILEADCREMFFEEIGAGVLRELSRDDFMARRANKRNDSRPIGQALELEQLAAE